MAIDALAVFLNILPGLVMMGLILDMIGAILLLAPDVEPVAKAATRWERRKLHRLIDLLEEGVTIDESYSNFENLQIAVGQRKWEGETERPVRLRDIDPNDLFYNFNIIENTDEGVYLTERGGGRGFGYTIEDLRRDADHFTATAREYYSEGGFALVTGFFMQFIGVFADTNPRWALWTFIVGGIVLIYIGNELR